jgi:hypothetical protein
MNISGVDYDYEDTPRYWMEQEQVTNIINEETERRTKNDPRN